MIIIPGPIAYSEFRNAKMVSEIAETISISDLKATYLHLISLTEEFKRNSSPNLESKLQDLLCDCALSIQPDFCNPTLETTDLKSMPTESSSTAGNAAINMGQKVLFVVPRPGTITPWSSKATDISSICGFRDSVKRIERAIRIVINYTDTKIKINWSLIYPLLYDKMTHIVLESIDDLSSIFTMSEPRSLKYVDILSQSNKDALNALIKANKDWGLALAKDEIDYLITNYISLNRNPTDAELMMFAQINSEHCRHKIFKAQWILNDKNQPNSLFGMIKNTYNEKVDHHVLSAYVDNAAVLEGYNCVRFVTDESNSYIRESEFIHTIVKVETHNHPTAISPFPGAATGAGGEIRDEGAVGQGSKPKAGLSGYTVSNLCIPNLTQPWETLSPGKPAHIASPLEIMIQAPVGAAAFNNEFGRPNISGYFRTYLEHISIDDEHIYRGYHKPIMIAGGVGSVREHNIHKQKITPGSHLIVLGGPSMLIGLGGGAASSMTSGSQSAELDFASVQRHNPEMERRCQQVIDACTNELLCPMSSIHDVGAGGLSNAFPELVHDSDLGAIFDIRCIPCDDPGMSPMEIWCNESQERYVLALPPVEGILSLFTDIARRERCPFAIVGVATEEKRLVLKDTLFNNVPIDLPMSSLFGETPPLNCLDYSSKERLPAFMAPICSIQEMGSRVLQLPSVSSKSFLITICDRSVTGLVARDQMVGPWQVPVADVSVTCTDYESYHGQAMCMGERTPIAIINPAASARMAVAESLTNIIAANTKPLKNVCLSANWMAAASEAGQGWALYEAVKAVGMDLCPKLGICIPVGKDSLSMKTKWRDEQAVEHCVVSPLSLIITAYAPVEDVRLTLSPEIGSCDEECVLLFLDLANGKQRLGGSALAQVYNQIGNEAPDVEDAEFLKLFWDFIQKHRNLILAYHDRSDGGLFTTLCEMAFAGRTGIQINLSTTDAVSFLFNEELGAVIEIRASHLDLFKSKPFGRHVYQIGTVQRRKLNNHSITIQNDGVEIFNQSRVTLQRQWSQTSFEIQKLRDEPECAQQEFDVLLEEEDIGLHEYLTYFPLLSVVSTIRPKVAVLREQGVNGHVEMAYSFFKVGFDVVDVHMSDILSMRISLKSFNVLACPGGFSYGDVLGAGAGWAKSILYNSIARNEFQSFFERKDTLTFGVCNGCQMLSGLKMLIPGAETWPKFVKNKSEQFEARLCMVKVLETNNVFLNGMAGSEIPVAVAHGEGRVNYQDKTSSGKNSCLQFIDNSGQIAGCGRYPFNPNGSVEGVTGFSTDDGRVLIMMPHPERMNRRVANTWIHSTKQAIEREDGPWMRLFQNARHWVKANHDL